MLESTLVTVSVAPAAAIPAWMPPRAIKRKKVVPTNSRKAACRSSAKRWELDFVDGSARKRGSMVERGRKEKFAMVVVVVSNREWEKE
jgi:hypothetical protein